VDDEAKGMSREIGNYYNIRIGPAMISSWSMSLDDKDIAGSREADDKTGSSCERKESDSFWWLIS